MSLLSRLSGWFSHCLAAPPRKGQPKRAHLHLEELESRRLLSTYYLSPTGSDNNAGTSASAAWQTIDKINHINFQAGDQILFQGGATFNGDLLFNRQDAGTATAPITIGSYGTGSATIKAGAGTGISLLNTQGFTIANLSIVGNGYATNTGDGINITNSRPGLTQAGIAINNVDVSGFGQVGIHVVSTKGVYSGISITYAATHDNGYGGLAVDGYYAYGHHVANIYIAYVEAYHNAGANRTDSGYGIYIIGADHVIVERSVTYDNGWLPGNGGLTGGIEAIHCDRVLLQYNESYANHAGPNDGDGIVLDITTNSIMQFNYTHDNDGAGLFLGAEPGYSSTNNVIRYNISQNDARLNNFGSILVWRSVSNAEIYNNTVFIGPSSTGTPSAIRILGLSGSSVHIRDNIFVTTGGVRLISYNGGGTDLLFQGNDYWSSGSTFRIVWGTTTYTSLTAWRAGSGQEKLNGAAVGYQVDPLLVNPGGGATLGNADLLNTLTAYQLQSTSSLRHAALDLSAFGISWDPYGFAEDPFFSKRFSLARRDFFGSALPAAGSNLFSIGADQFT